MIRPSVVLFAFTWLLLSSPASATPVRIDFSGAFSAALDPGGLLDELPLGTPFSGFVEYDTSWPRGAAGDFFSTPSTSGRIRITFAGTTTTRLGELSIHVEDDGPRGDELVISGLIPVGAFFAGSEILRFDVIYVAFRDPSGAMFSNDALQAYVPQGIAAQAETTGCRWTAESQFDYCDQFSGDTFLASLAIDAYWSVPEPGAAALVALGIALLAGRSGIR